MTSGQFIWIWWLSKGTRSLFGEEQTHKFSFISGLKCSLFASFSAPCEQSIPLSSWVRRIKAGSVWIAQSFEVAAARTFGLVNLVLSRQIVFFLFECEHPFIVKPMVITEPAVASVRLLGLQGSKLSLHPAVHVQEGSSVIPAESFSSTLK